MNIEKLNILNQIYNTLRLIDTKDQSTIFMSDCLLTLKNFILSEANNLNNTVECGDKSEPK